MTIALLQGEYLPLAEARISPMDRGFLFGDGIYEVIPSYGGKMVGLQRHLQRLDDGLKALAIPNPMTLDGWQATLSTLIAKNGSGNLGLYLQVTRGVAETRQHHPPANMTPTVFGYTFPIQEPSDGTPGSARGFSVSTGADQRWKRCHIKSTALLGSVLHMMEGSEAGSAEILLFNQAGELTEAAACNVFIVSGQTISTPALDTEKLPGVTRNMLIDMLLAQSHWVIKERSITHAEVLAADEVWLTSSTKEVAPVLEIDGRPVGNGRAGPGWMMAQKLFATHRFDF